MQEGPNEPTRRREWGLNMIKLTMFSMTISNIKIPDSGKGEQKHSKETLTSESISIKRNFRCQLLRKSKKCNRKDKKRRVMTVNYLLFLTLMWSRGILLTTRNSFKGWNITSIVPLRNWVCASYAGHSSQAISKRDIWSMNHILSQPVSSRMRKVSSNFARRMARYQAIIQDWLRLRTLANFLLGQIGGNFW